MLVAQCHAYLRFAPARPGLFRLKWRKEVLDIDDPEHIAAAKRAFAISDRAVRGDDAVMVSPSDAATSPTIACWSMVHGSVALIIEGAFFAREPEIRGSFDIMLDATLQHLEIG